MFIHFFSKRKILVSTFLLLTTSALTAKTFYIDANLKSSQGFWDVGLSEEEPNNSLNVIKYDTEGLGYYHASIDVGIDNYSIFKYTKLNSFSNSEHQQDLLVSNQTQTQSLDGYSFILSPLVLTDILNISNRWIQLALTWEFKYTTNAFYATGTAQRDLYYYTNNTESSYIPSQSNISFKTTFEDQRHLFTAKIGKSFWKIGVYQSTWERPATSGEYTNGNPNVELTKYSSKGLSFVYSSYANLKGKGFNGSISFDYGIDNSLEYSKAGKPDYNSLGYVAYTMDFSYKIVSISTPKNTLSFEMGGTLNSRTWSVSNNDKQNPIIIDGDTIYSLYGSVEYFFKY